MRNDLIPILMVNRNKISAKKFEKVFNKFGYNYLNYKENMVLCLGKSTRTNSQKQYNTATSMGSFFKMRSEEDGQGSNQSYVDAYISTIIYQMDIDWLNSFININPIIRKGP